MKRSIYRRPGVVRSLLERSAVCGGAMLGAALSPCLANSGHNVWSTAAALPTPTSWSAAATLNDHIYVVGGINSSQAETADTEIYDPATNAWSAGVPLPNPIFGATAAVVRNVLYVFGGYTSNNVATTDVWAFNPTRTNGPRKRRC